MKKYNLIIIFIMISFCSLHIVNAAETTEQQKTDMGTILTVEKPEETVEPLIIRDAEGNKVYYESEGYRYSYVGAEKGIRIHGFSTKSALEKQKHVVIPATLDGYPVTRIAKNSFAFNKTIESVTIPGSIEIIGCKSFMMCRFLKSVDIGDGVKTIQSDAFYMCRKLLHVSGGASVEKLDLRAFQYCTALKAVPKFGGKSVFSQKDVFANTGIERVKIDKNMKVSTGMFQNSKKLRTVDLSGLSQTDIAAYLFQNCSRLKTVKLGRKLRYIGGYNFYNCRKLTSVNIPNKVEWIGPKAFGNCKSLKKLKLPKSINKIEKNAFQGCKKLTLYVKKGSYAYNYAKKHHIKYKYYK